jgi:hypothetical protein
MAGMYFWEWVLQGISNGVYGGGQLLWRTCGIEGIGISEHAYGRYEYSGNGEVREK